MISLLKNNTKIYFTAIAIIIGIDYTIIILILIMSFRIKNDKLNILWPVTILKYCLPFFSFSFFGQSFLLKLTIFDCKNGSTFINEEIKCRTRLWFSFLSPFTFLALLFHVTYAIITNLLYYKPKFINYGSDLLKKINTFPDIVFIITKIGINILFILDKENENEHWTIICILVLLSGTNAYYSLNYQNRINKTLSILNNIFCLILFSSFYSLFIGKLLKSYGFSGSIYIFLCFPIIIIIFRLTNKINDLDYILIDHTEIDNSIDYLYYICKYYDIIVNKNNSRNNLTTLKSLISKIEENCILEDCPLKKYLDNIKIGLEYRFLLYQYCEKLFQYGIEKFSDDISLKTNYSIFLITEMNDMKKASIILKNIKNKRLSFQNNYNIYISLNLINKYNCSSDYENINFKYRKSIQEFKELIKNSLLLYHDFMSLLLNSRIKNIDNFKELNILGSQIMKYNPKIDDIYNRLINIKTDNIEIIKLYSEFVDGVLKDEEKLKKCQKVAKLTYINNIDEIQENNYSNFDIEILNEKGNIPYLIVSGNQDYLGKILNISTSICKIFGYSKNEIIGQNINFILPKLFRKNNDLLTSQQYEKHILKIFNDVNTKKIYFPDIIRKDLYGINKMKFLIELKLNIYFVKTEESKLIYIIEILNYNPFKIDLINNYNNNSKFCILTDDNFIIQSFTSNCYEYLKLNYKYIDSNVNITNFIKQFDEDYLSALNNSIVSKQSYGNNTGNYSEKLNEKNKVKINKTPKIKLKLNNDMLIKKFSKKSKITWKLLDELNLSNSSKIFKRYSNNIKPTESNNLKRSKIENNKYNNNHYYSNNNYFEKKNIYENVKNSTFNEKEIDLYMEIDKIIVKQELLGYYFYFTKPTKKNLNNMSYIIPNYKKRERKNNFINVRKYQCKFKEIDNNSEEYIFDSDKNSMNCSLIVKPNKYIKKNDKYNNKSPKASFKENEEDKNSSNFSSFICKKNEISDEILESIKPDNRNNEGVITGEFVPKFSTHFSINIDRLTYFQLNEEEKSKNYEEYLRKEANDKILEYQRQIKYSSNGSDSNSEEFEEFESGEYSSSYISNIKKETSNSYSHSNSFPQSPKNNNKSPNFEKKKSQKIKTEKDNSETNFNSNKRIFQQKRNSLINNNYYKVELKNVRYWIFDYNKDMIVLGNKNFIVSKIETIINDLKKKDPFTGEDYKNFSFLSILKSKNKNNIKNHKENINEESDIKESSDNNANKNIVLKKQKTINENKIIERKINEALNRNEDEIPIKRLKSFVLLCYIVMMIYCCLLMIFDLLYIGYFKECLNIIKSLIKIKYCSHISIYYLRELTLLNFDMNEIEGGEYWNIPDNNKENYVNLIKEELIELFIENQSSMKILFSSSLSLSDNALKNISETILNIKMLFYPKKNIKFDIYTALMQYNSAFYNLALSTSDIKQNHTDIYNYIYNNLNGYKIAINILMDLYKNELGLYRYNILIVFTWTCILLILCSLLANYFLFQILKQAIETRGNYMKVFYGINENTLNMLIFNCETLINKLKSSEEQKYHEEETLYESINDKMTFKKNQSKKQLNLNYNDNKAQNKDSSYDILFASFFIIFTLISFSYFVFNTEYVINISRKSISFAKLWFKIQEYNLEIVNMFNSYREYLFDNQSFINDMIVLEYIVQAEREELTSISESRKYIEANYLKLINNILNESLVYYNDLCAFYINNFFDSSEMCSEIIGIITKYDFFHMTFYFLEEIKIKKNIVRYKLKYGKIVGNLTEYKYLDYLEDENIPKKGSNNNIFRLDLFNNEEIHFSLNLVFFSIILPYIQKNRKLDFSIFSIDKVDRFFFLVNIVFFIILSFLFFFYFIPVINYINNTIYKTKNMLSIIPLSILSTQNGVKTLLNLSDK